MVKKEVLLRKLVQLNENTAILQTLSKYSLTQFLESPERYGSTERFLQLSIEILDDIGSHIVSDEQLGEVASYADVPRLLLDKKYISQQQCDAWIQMVGFRNILVHGYAKVDRKIVYQVLQNNLKDLEEIGRQLSQLA